MEALPERPASIVGTEFTHAAILDPAWVPGEGQRYADSPKAVMVVTSVTGTTVYYRFADRYGFPGTRGVFRMEREVWDATYAPPPVLSEPTPDQSHCDLGQHQQCSGYTEDESDPETCMCPCHDHPFN